MTIAVIAHEAATLEVVTAQAAARGIHVLHLHHLVEAQAQQAGLVFLCWVGVVVFFAGRFR